MPTTRTATDAVAMLNELANADPEAIAALIEKRVPVNGALESHPTAQCGAMFGVAVIGMLGVLNAIFGADEVTGCGHIGAEYDDAGSFVRFIVMHHKPD